VRRTGLDAARVAAALAELELLGVIEQADGLYRASP
jgi:predicted Rossmann fold nucleotide-binding protein DprA/Smf involved in DNA uptake